MAISSVYFFCYPHGPPDRAGYEHEIVCLAEGLRQLGLPFSGNVDYWQEGNSPNDFLIRHDPRRSHRDADVVIFSSVLYDYEATALLPPDLLNPARRYRLLFIDASDGLWTPGFRDEIRACDLVLKCHYNRKYPLPDNFRPWAFGLSERIIQQLTGDPAATARGKLDRKAELLINYRVEHSLRDCARKKIIPLLQGILAENRTTDTMEQENETSKDRLLWEQSGRRHSPSYYRRLLACEACSCFGGTPEKWTTHLGGRFGDCMRDLDEQYSLFHYDRIHQFDSWRLWEAFASGASVFHADLQHYGCLLPVMPVNREHYLGFNLTNPLPTVDRIRKEPGIFRRIGEAGKMWALEHYSPEAVARRFLNLLTR